VNKDYTVSETSIWNRNFILNLAVTFSLFLSMYMLLPTLPIYARTLGGNETIAGTIVGLFTLSSVLVRPLFGNLLDRQGRKLILITGIIISIIAILAHNLAFHLVTLMVLRVIHGIGWGASTTATLTIASDLIPAEKRNEGMGFYGISSIIAMSLGPALGLSLLNYSFSMLITASTILAALGLFVTFFINYEKSQNKIVRKAETRPGKVVIFEKTAIPPALVLLFITLTYGGIVSFIPLYAGNRGIQNIGLFFTVYAIVLLISRPLIGRLADRYGGRKFVAPGILLIAAALVLLVKADSLPLFLLSGIVYGLGFATVQPILNAVVVSLAPPERRGAANATFSTAMDLGIGIGSILLGFIVQKAGYEYMYGISAIIPLLAIAIYYLTLYRKLAR
jgi:MFS family permease